MNLPIWYSIDISAPLHPIPLQQMLVSGDNKANRIGVKLFDYGQPYNPGGGNCYGFVLRRDGATVPILDGVISGNEMYIDLPEAAYAVQGSVVISISHVTPTNTTTVFVGTGSVIRTQSGTVIDPGEVTLDVNTLIQSIEAAVATIPADYTAFQKSVAPFYSDLEFPVSAGQLCWHTDNDVAKLYRAKQDLTSENWTPSHWEAAVVGDELAAIQGEVSDLANMRSATNTISGFEQGYRHGRTGAAKYSNENWVITASPVQFYAGQTIHVATGYEYTVVDPTPANNGAWILNVRTDDYTFQADVLGYVEVAVSGHSTAITPSDAAGLVTVTTVYHIVSKVTELDTRVTALETGTPVDDYAMAGGHRVTASEIESGSWAYSNKADNSKRLRNKELYPVFAGMAVRYTNPTLQVCVAVLQTKSSNSFIQYSGWLNSGGSGTYTIDYDGYLVFLCQSANDITVSDYDCTVEILSAESAAIDTWLSELANDLSAYTVTGQINISAKGIDTSGAQVAVDAGSCSGYIHIYNGWSVAYSGLKMTSSYNVLSFYGPDKKFVSGVAGQGASTGVSGTFTAPSDGYIRLCVRTDKKADASVTITPTLAARLAGMESLLGISDAVFSNTSGPVEQQINIANSSLNSSGAVVSTNNISRSAFIYVPAGYFVKYSNLRGGTSNALLCYYTAKDQSTFSGSAVMGQGATTEVSGYYKVPASGYIRLSTRSDFVSSAKVTLVAPFSSGQTITKYVSPSGNNANSGDSFVSAYATIAKALAMGANTIYLAAGNYTETVYAVGVQVKLIGQGSKFTHSGAYNVFEFRSSVVEMENITVDMTGASSSGNNSGIFVKDCFAKFSNCKVLNAPYMGFRFDGSYAIVTHCLADGAGVDGFNGHDTANNITEGFFIGCVAKNCGDDGLSFHEEGKIHVLGGEYANCASTGIAPHNNCNCDIRDAYVHHNGRAGIEALVGSYTIPNPLPTMILSGCMFEGNTGNAVTAEHYIVKASANGASGNGANSIVNSSGSTITTFALMT